MQGLDDLSLTWRRGELVLPAADLCFPDVHALDSASLVGLPVRVMRWTEEISHRRASRSNSVSAVGAVYDRLLCPRFEIVGAHRPPLPMRALKLGNLHSSRIRCRRKPERRSRP